jgi:hypothetical protein
VAERDIKVRFVGDTKDLEKATGKAESSTSKLGKAFGGMGKALALGAAAAGAALAGMAVKFASDAVGLASDTSESLSKVQQVFGDSAKSIDEWSKTTSSALGISRKDSLAAAGNFGAMFDGMKIATAQSAPMSKAMVKLAADLGSFNNADPTAVMDSLGAAFRGEFDSVQKFVPTINAAAVATEALAETGKKNADQLTDQEKAMATYNLLMKGAGKATDDFSRTSGGLANQTKIASARFEDLQANIGAELLPIMNALMAFVANVLIPGLAAAVGWIEDNWPKVEKAIAPVIERIMAVLDIFVTVATALWDKFGSTIILAARQAWQFVSGLFRAYVTILGGIVDLITSLLTGKWGKAWDAVKQIINGALLYVRTLIGGFISQLRVAWSAVTAIFGDPIRAALDIARGLIDQIVGLFQGLPTRIAGFMSGVAQIITAPYRAAFGAIKQLWNSTVGGFGFSVPSWIPGVGGKSFKIPEMAAGGIVTGPMVAMIGEAGPEAVIPLDRLGPGMGAPVINITVQVTGLGPAPERVGAEVVKAIQAWERVNGQLWRVA